MARAVDACRVITAGPLVATGTVHRLRRNVVIRMLPREVRVATRAGIGGVNRTREAGLVDKKRDPLACGIGLEKGLVGMALQAGGIRVLFGRWSRDADQAESQARCQRESQVAKLNGRP